MNYNEAVEYLYGIPRFAGKTTADNTLRMLELLGNPQKDIKIFHVAGSNGKGSVCAFLNSILVNSGIHTGMFTSPHLVKPNERIKVDNIPISDEEFLEVFTEVYQMIENNRESGMVHPSFFEFIFLMCMLSFRKNSVRYAVIEVGLGGRLDATNVLSNVMASVITSVSLEHTEILGDTIEKIAWEKAGIIKQNVPVIYDAGVEEAETVISSMAIKKNAVCYPVRPENIKIAKKDDKYIDFSPDSSYYDIGILRVSFPAEYQTMNATLACVALKAAAESNYELRNISDRDIQAGIRNTSWEGRMEHIGNNVYLDGAHNMSGIEKFIETVNGMEVTGDKYLLFGVVKDKKYEKMIELLVRRTVWEHIYIAAMNTGRAADTEEIRKIFAANGIAGVTVFGSVREAYEYAVSIKKQEDVLFCAGSLYLIGEIKEFV